MTSGMELGFKLGGGGGPSYLFKDLKKKKGISILEFDNDALLALIF